MTNFENAFAQADLKKVLQAEYLDLWVMEHFRVLPTDERFLKLSLKQKALLFTAFLELPTDEMLHMGHRLANRAPEIDDDEADNLKNLGYSDEQIKRMRAQLKAAGL